MITSHQAASPFAAFRRLAAAVACAVAGVFGASAAQAGEPVKLLIELPPDVSAVNCGETVDLQIVGEDAGRTRVGFGGKTVEFSATYGNVEVVQQPYKFRFRAPATLPDVTNVRIRAWLKEAPEVVGETTVPVIPPAPFRRLVLQGAGSTPAGASVDLFLRGETAAGTLTEVPEGTVTLTVTGPGRVTLLRTSRYRFETDMNASGTARIVASLVRYPNVTGTLDILVTGGSGGAAPAVPQNPTGIAVLTVESAAFPSPVEVGGQFTFVVNVTNQGNASATNVTLTAALSPLQRLVSVDTSRAGGVAHTAAQDSVRFAAIPTLAAASTVSYRITLQAVTAGDARLTADVTADQQRAPITKVEMVRQVGGGGNAAQTSAMRLEAIGSPNPIEVGGQATFSVRVTNQGAAAERNVTITATLPANQRFVSASGGGGQPTVSGQTLRFTPVASLAPGAMLDVRVVVAATAGGNARFAVEVVSDAQRSPVTQFETISQIGAATGPGPVPPAPFNPPAPPVAPGTNQPLNSNDDNADAVVWTSGAVRLETWRLRDTADAAWTPIDRKLPAKGSELVANRNIQKVRIGVIAANVAKIEVEEWSGDKGAITQLKATKDGRLVIVERKDGTRAVHYELTMPEGNRAMSMAVIVTTTDGKVTRDEFTFRRK